LVRREIVLTTLAQYVEHAEKYGVEEVYETAEMTCLVELDSLARHLRRIDGAWRLQPDQRTRLIAELRDRGFTNQEIAERAEVSLSTINRGAGPSKSDPKYRMVEPSKSVKMEEDKGNDYPLPNDTFEAAQRHLWDCLTRAPLPVKGTWRAWVYGGKNVRHAGTSPRNYTETIVSRAR
jgi:hypothetical protein